MLSSVATQPDRQPRHQTVGERHIQKKLLELPNPTYNHEDKKHEKVGIDFVSLRESVDTSTPTGKAVFTIIAAIAELERSTIRERVIAGQKASFYSVNVQLLGRNAAIIGIWNFVYWNRTQLGYRRIDWMKVNTISVLIVENLNGPSIKPALTRGHLCDRL